jgi:hypothetical protein
VAGGQGVHVLAPSPSGLSNRFIAEGFTQWKRFTERPFEKQHAWPCAGRWCDKSRAIVWTSRSQCAIGSSCAVREPCLELCSVTMAKGKTLFSREFLQLACPLSCSEPPCWSLHSTRVSKPTTDSVVEDQQCDIFSEKERSRPARPGEFQTIRTPPFRIKA